MKEENNQYKFLTLKGLRQVVIFYSIMFSTSVLIIFTLSITKPTDIVLIIISFFSIFALISLLGIYFGIGKVFNGNKGFGKAHEISTLKAKKIITWGLIFYLLSVFFILPSIQKITLIHALYRTIIFIPFWLALVYLIIGIAEDRIKNLLWIAVISRGILLFISNYYGLSYGYYSDENYSGFSYLIPLISIIPSFIFIYCYFSTYKKVKNIDPIIE